MRRTAICDPHLGQMGFVHIPGMDLLYLCSGACPAMYVAACVLVCCDVDKGERPGTAVSGEGKSKSGRGGGVLCSFLHPLGLLCSLN